MNIINNKKIYISIISLLTIILYGCNPNKDITSTDLKTKISPNHKIIQSKDYSNKEKDPLQITVEKASSLISEGKYDTALDEIYEYLNKNTIDKGNKLIPILFDLGSSAILKGKYNNDIIELKDKIIKTPNDNLIIQLGDILYKRGDEIYFLGNLQETNTSNNKNNSLSNFVLFNYMNALQAYESAIKINPKNDDARYKKGLITSDIGLGDDKALQAYENAIKLNQKNSLAWYKIGNILSNSGDDKKAIEYYEKSLLIDDSNYNARNNLGNAYKGEGEYSDAIKAYTKSFEKYDINKKYLGGINKRMDIVALKNRGNTYIEMGYKDKGINDFKKALELDPNNQEIKDLLNKYQD